MDKILIIIGFIILFTSIVLVNFWQRKIPVEVASSYRSTVKPGFVKLYLLSVLPLGLVLYLLIDNRIYLLFENFHYILAALLIFDAIAILRLNKLVKAAGIPQQYSGIRWLLASALTGKTIIIFGIKYYIQLAL